MDVLEGLEVIEETLESDKLAEHDPDFTGLVDSSDGE